MIVKNFNQVLRWKRMALVPLHHFSVQFLSALQGTQLNFEVVGIGIAVIVLWNIINIQIHGPGCFPPSPNEMRVLSPGNQCSLQNDSIPFSLSPTRLEQIICLLLISLWKGWCALQDSRSWIILLWKTAPSMPLSRMSRNFRCSPYCGSYRRLHDASFLLSQMLHSNPCWLFSMAQLYHNPSSNYQLSYPGK